MYQGVCSLVICGDWGKRRRSSRQRFLPPMVVIPQSYCCQSQELPNWKCISYAFICIPVYKLPYMTTTFMYTYKKLHTCKYAWPRDKWTATVLNIKHKKIEKKKIMHYRIRMDFMNDNNWLLIWLQLMLYKYESYVRLQLVLYLYVLSMVTTGFILIWLLCKLIHRPKLRPRLIKPLKKKKRNPRFTVWTRRGRRDVLGQRELSFYWDWWRRLRT